MRPAITFLNIQLSNSRVGSMRHLQNCISSYMRQNLVAKKAFNDNQNEIWYT